MGFFVLRYFNVAQYFDIGKSGRWAIEHLAIYDRQINKSSGLRPNSRLSKRHTKYLINFTLVIFIKLFLENNF